MKSYLSERKNIILDHLKALSQRFWEGKTVVEYNEFPYQQMKSVYERKSIMIEWKPMLETLISAAFTRCAQSQN